MTYVWYAIFYIDFYFAGEVHIINKNNMFHSFFRPGNHIFLQIFKAKRRCAVCKPNDSNIAYSTLLSYKATPTKGHPPSY
jgi:hypothetical protein